MADSPSVVWHRSEPHPPMNHDRNNRPAQDVATVEVLRTNMPLSLTDWTTMTDLTIEQAGVPAPLVTAAEVAAKLAPASLDRITGIDGERTPIVVVGGSVRGSGPVAAQLVALGSTDIVHVAGGFPAWKEAGFPTWAPVTDEVPSSAGVG